MKTIIKAYINGKNEIEAVEEAPKTIPVQGVDSQTVFHKVADEHNAAFYMEIPVFKLPHLRNER